MAVSIKDVMDFFGKGDAGLKGFQQEWTSLTDDDKAQIKQGLDDKSLTY